MLSYQHRTNREESKVKRRQSKKGTYRERLAKTDCGLVAGGCMIAIFTPPSMTNITTLL
ncbi:hypothetical protein K445DRAFT_312714 [Daldinia sp. EC12]|nr:hypothetical protein K445DRAFT_312714 [Daldinia sp. EC12]